MFKILSLLERKVNLRQNPFILPTIPSVCCCTTLWKLEVWVLAYLEKNANDNVTCVDFWTHPILMHLAYLLSCCFNFTFLLNILCKQNSGQFYLNKCCELKQCFLHVWHCTVTRPSLTVQLMSGVDIFAHVYRQKVDPSSNYCDNI